MKRFIVLLCVSAMAGPAIASPPGSEDASSARSPTLTSRAQSNLNGRARGPEIEWMPVSATGPHAISGNEITLSGGGQEVTLEIHLSGWGSAPGNPSLGGYLARLDSTGYSSGSGDPLSPKGWPATPEQGCFIDETRTDFVFYGLTPITATDTTTLDYKWLGAQMGGAKVDDGGTYYGGTLIVDVPAGAAGTYTLDFDPSDVETYMVDESAVPIPGLTLTAGQITIGQPQDPECPADTLNNPPIGQPGHSANDPWWSGATSDSDAGAGYLRYESFVGLTEPICDIHWWGFDRWYNGSQWVECDEDPMTFDINFYTDVGGQPGSVVCSYTLPVPRAYFGDYNGRDLFAYATTLDPCCSLTSGWVSIQGLDGDPNCWFLWLTSGVGDGTSWFWNGSAMELYDSDLSLCLTPEHEWEHKMHFPQLPDEDGWDVSAENYMTGTMQCLADDWQCSETGYVTDIHFWGSWHGDIDVGTFVDI